MPLDIMGKRYVTPREIATGLNLNYRTILRYLRDGKIVGKRFGKKIIIEENVFQAFLDKNGLN